MNKYKIAFATGSRADYGIVRHYLRFLNQDETVDLQILVTGALLDEKYGRQVDLIYADGFHIGAELQVPLDSSSNAKILHTMAEIMDKFGELFGESTFDLLIVLGDRYEMLSVAIAAAMQRIPILHIHGGEATYGNYDEFIRHAITKMSHFHFTATEEYRKRVIQMGESPEHVFNLGALGAENCLDIHLENVPEEIKKLDPKRYFVLLIHPETLTETKPAEQIQELLSAIDCYPDYQFVFLGTNADTCSHVIREATAKFVATHKNAVYFESLHPDAYHFLLKNSICLIGNSSSGIIEAPSLGVYTINIGDRQRGRVKGSSVLDVEYDKDRIFNSIHEILSRSSPLDNMDNPYLKKGAAKEYYHKTIEVAKELRKSASCRKKEFHDLHWKG